MYTYTHAYWDPKPLTHPSAPPPSRHPGTPLEGMIR